MPEKVSEEISSLHCNAHCLYRNYCFVLFISKQKKCMSSSDM